MSLGAPDWEKPGVLTRQGDAMEQPFELKRLARLPVLSINASVQSGELNDFLVRSCNEIFGYLGRLGVRPAGPPFAVYFDPVERGGVVERSMYGEPR